VIRQPAEPTPVIVSATRRADIPAHYAAWFMNRIRAEWCAVPNPFNTRQVSRVSLASWDVAAIVFWTRDPRPLMPHLRELESLGHRFVFQFTLLEYPPSLHPGMPPLAERLDAFKRLAASIGPDRVLWRYDPIVLTRETNTGFHRRNFEVLCRELAGHTRRVTVSLMEPYRKARSRLDRAGAVLMAPTEEELSAMFSDMAALAQECTIEPVSCADEAGLDSLGFTPGACMDAALLERLFGLKVANTKDLSQRPACRCAKSRDIGMYDACPAGCAYCYATRDFSRSRRAMAGHDPDSPSLIGRFEPKGRCDLPTTHNQA
jgi:hypothetical protein